MSFFRSNRSWLWGRRIFRWFRIALLLLILGSLVAVLWLNRVGVPDFLKRPLLVQLQEHGLDVEFVRMRLKWQRGIVVEEARLTGFRQAQAARMAFTEVNLAFNHDALWRLNWQLDGVLVRGGRLEMPVPGGSSNGEPVRVENIRGELRFAQGDVWDLHQLQGEWQGVALAITASITNGSEVIRWVGKRSSSGTSSNLVAQLDERLRQFQVAPAAELAVKITGDAARPDSFLLEWFGTAPQISSPWGSAQNLSIRGRVHPMDHPGLRAFSRITFWNATTPQVAAHRVELRADLAQGESDWRARLRTHLDLSGVASDALGRLGRLRVDSSFASPTNEARWVGHHQVIVTGWQHRLARLAAFDAEVESDHLGAAWHPFAGRIKSNGRGIHTGGLNLPAFELSAAVRRDTNATTFASQWLSNAVFFTLRAPALEFAGTRLENLSVTGHWKGDELALAKSSLRLGLITVPFEGVANLAVPKASIRIEAPLTWTGLTNALPVGAQPYLKGLQWPAPLQTRLDLQWHPKASGSDNGDDWIDALSATGALQTPRGTVRGLEVAEVSTGLHFTNGVLRLTDLKIARADGALTGELEWALRPQRFHARLRTDFDPNSLKTFLPPAERPALNLFVFTTAPIITAHLEGQVTNLATLQAKGHVLASNFTFRGESLKRFETDFAYSNLFCRFLTPKFERAEGTAEATEATYDFTEGLITLTNLTAAMEAAPVVRALGPKIARLMDPYSVEGIARAQIHGVIDLHEKNRTDMVFHVGKTPFRWKALHWSELSGSVHWQGTHLALTNLQGVAYGGAFQGWAVFDFDADDQATVRFSTRVKDMQLEAFLADAVPRTNRLEGLLTARLDVTHLRTDDLKSWRGYGNVSLQDGYIWEYPLFAVFSPILNRLTPGLGNSRAREATARFTMTNSVVHSSDLEIHASGMRMHGDGWVDFDGRIQGRIEAALFRDTPGVGLLVSKLLWPVTKALEYKVSGTLNQPKAEPLYLPRILMMPLHPVRTLKELIEERRERQEGKPPAPENN